MNRGFHFNEKAAYRVLNACLLACIVLFGAERFLGIGEPKGMHVAVVLAVPGVLAGINYMTARGRIICLAVLLIILCAAMAAGSGGSVAFWQSFFPWLLGRGSAPGEWELGYGLLQTAMLAGGCYLLQILFEKVSLLKDGAAVVLSGILVFCLLAGREMNHFGVAFLICYVLIVWEEHVQKHWEKRRGKRGGFEAHTFWILPFLALYLVLLAVMPVPEKPYDWMWAKNIYHQLKEPFLAYIQNIKWGSREGFGMAFTGFSRESDMGGDLHEVSREIMHVQVQSTAVDYLYLTGAVYDNFDGRGWSQTQEGYDDAAFLDTAQTLYAVKNYNMQYQGDYLKEIRADIRYEDFRTGYVFAPLKVWGLEKENSRKGPDYVCEDGTLCWNGRKGYGTEYTLHYFRMNAGQPQFDLFLEEAGRAETENPEVNREVWETVMAECEKRVGRVFSLKDLDDCKKEIYERYLGQVRLSEEIADWLGKIVADAGTNVEKLRAIERALSALTYTLTPGELPDSVADAGDFLDYFLLESRQGYCTYFATAFVLLARAEGIPARYVQGYCIPLGEQGEALVYSNMAHAWPEIYLDGVGWIPFEPTPGYGSARLDSWKLRQPVEDSMPDGDSLPGENSESAPAAGDGEYAPDADGTDEEDADSGEEKVTGYSWRLFGYTVSAVLCVCGILLAIDNALGRYRYRRMDPVERYRAEVFRNLKVLSRFGPERQEWETLEEFRERAGHMPGLYREGSEMPLRFFENYERVVYGGEVVGEDMIKEVLEEREQLFELLKEEKKWVWLYCRIRMYLGKYRF
ncbi:MAG: DUF3488 and transglutaminase-like domain-containing protein [Acetatifactor sp.]|nr:DUF3488 and transglutaminase-like domain-containing protein [Acetatifactor sp.]